MTIRTARLSDLPEIVAIYNQAVAERFCTADLQPLAVEDRRGWFDEHDPDRYPLLVLERGAEIVGWATLGPWRAGRRALGTVAELSYYVAREHRGEGVGTLLVEHATERAREIGYENLLALLFGVNEVSLGLLRKAGFSEWGRFPGIAVVEGARYDQVVWGRRLQ